MSVTILGVRMRIGIFHPCLNICGGGEWVALNIIDTLREKGHKVIVLTDDRIDQEKFIKTFGQKINADEEIIFPFHFFKRPNAHNVYTDTISCLILKTKCDMVIDTYTRLILPFVDITYMHYPIYTRYLPQSNLISHLKNSLFFLLYHAYELCARKNKKRIIFANSKFTSKAISIYHNVHSHILYPSLSPFYLADEKEICSGKRNDQIVTISRYAPEKNLETIPHIANQIENATFIIMGNLHHKGVYDRLLRLTNDLNVAARVVLMADVPKDKLKQILLSSKVYLHCAINEHFGISLIEAIAGGCLPVSHDSGGPREIVPDEFRYKTTEEAIEKINKAIAEWSPEKAMELRNGINKFSADSFSKEFISVLESHEFFNN
jgi:alpha-1,2-mannosyltransferase